MRRVLIGLLLAASALGASKPNVLFISVDDLNDWIGCMGGNPQSVTPNFDRLAASGMLFRNAHCVAPACNPSRTAVMTGLSPHKTGVYGNGQKMRDVLPGERILPKYFSEHGYWSGGSGKMLHYFTDAESWDVYFPEAAKETPIPRTYYPTKRPVSLPRAGAWQYVETDWGAMPVDDETFGGDYLVSEWVGEQLAKRHDKPFFLACGIYRPHEPWFVPEKYFDAVPLDEVQLPPGYKEDDLADLPSVGKQVGRNRYFAHIREAGQWKQGVQGYLASIRFADAMLGRVLDALEAGPNKDNTIVVLWSDHGWHLGSKEHWQKFTAWRQCTRVPLMVRLPKGASAALPEGVQPGLVCDEPVSLISLFPTLTELCGLPGKPGVDGRSIVPLLKDPSATVDPVAITYLHRVGSVGISGKDWRYLRYDDGSEELYHVKADPYEWHNLAADPQHAAKLASFRDHVPKTFAPKPTVKVRDLPTLKWHAADAGTVLPTSEKDAGRCRLVFVNRSGAPVIFHEVSHTGDVEKKGRVAPGRTAEVASGFGRVWLVTDVAGKRLGYLRQLDRSAKAVIPAQ